jgi:hypothetical protein
MRQISINPPVDVEADLVLRAVQRAIENSRLRIVLLTTLKRYPGSIHWHLKDGRQPGTLELTWWPKRRRLWFSVQKRRSAEWIDSAAAELQLAIRNNLTSALKRRSSEDS